MLTIILYCILGWIAIGVVSWFFKVFIYFRGPTNYVSWMALACKKLDDDIETADRISSHVNEFIVSMLLIGIVIGPISILEAWSVIVRTNRTINLMNTRNN